MLNSYRRKFILLNMALVGTVLFLTLAAVGLYMCRGYYHELERTMVHVLEPLSPLQPSKGQGGRPTGPWDGQDRSGITTVFYSQGELSIFFRSPQFEADVIQSAVGEILRRDASFGLLPEYDMIYCRFVHGGDVRIAVTGTGYILEPMLRLIGTLLLTFCAAMLLFYLISRYISRLAVKPLEEAMARERQFIADASHDLKTPLAVILANNSILRQTAQDVQGRWLDSTETAAKNMLSMVDEMLTLSEAESSDAPKLDERVDLSAVVTKAVLQMESVAYEGGVELTAETAEHVMVNGDGEYLRRIAASLIENALKYEPRGGAINVRLDSFQNRAVLSVHNATAVISGEDLPHIFDRFYRSDKSRQSKGGHGLGLSIAKRMAERMGARIEVDSRPGSGATFRVTFRGAG